MPRPRDLPDEVVWLDFAGCSRLALEFKRGHLARPILRFRLIEECGLFEHEADDFIGLIEDLTMAEAEEQLDDHGEKPVTKVLVRK
jgi:hypothetical protein